MLKNILNLDGAQELDKSQQTQITGGSQRWVEWWEQCGGGFCCLTLPDGEVLREPCRCPEPNYWNWGCILL